MLSVQAVSKYFGSHAALVETTFDIPEGEFFSLLGPSGCGKTTLLRIIGGQEVASRGKVILDGVDLTPLSPAQRPLNMIFQRLALFPHLDVQDNISFGLRLKKISETEIKKRVADALDLIELPNYAGRSVVTLSGGQQQRVAIARALVNEPKLLLLDEPLSALDEKIRQKLQIELRSLQKKLNMTFVFVTHAQEEALSFSDRIAVMKQGKIEQIGTPEEIYHRPETPFVAGFIGTSNFILGESSGDGILSVGEVQVRGHRADNNWQNASNAAATLVVRPEHLQILPSSTELSQINAIPAIVERQVFRGEHYEIYCRMQQSPHSLLIAHANRSLPAIGSPVVLSWHPGNSRIMQGHHA